MRATRQAFRGDRQTDGTWTAKPVFTKRIPRTADFAIDGPEFELYQKITRFVKRQSARAASQGDDPRARAVDLDRNSRFSGSKVFRWSPPGNPPHAVVGILAWRDPFRVSTRGRPRDGPGKKPVNAKRQALNLIGEVRRRTVFCIGLCSSQVKDIRLHGQTGQFDDASLPKSLAKIKKSPSPIMSSPSRSYRASYPLSP